MEKKKLVENIFISINNISFYTSRRFQCKFVYSFDFKVY